MANSWWVIVPQGDQSQPDSYKQQVDFRVQFQPGSQEYSALQARQPVSYDGMSWVYWKGPYATEAEAQAAQNPQASPNPQQAAARALKPVTGALTSVNDFLSRLTSANLWMRIGEVVAGLILLGIGLNAMLHGQPLKVVTGAAGAVGKLVP